MTTQEEEKTGYHGNTNSVKFKTPEDRQALCDAWCAHLNEGYSRESFPLCDPQTFRTYIKKYPEDFDRQKLRAADAMQQLKWEQRLASLAETNEGSAAATIFGLKNIAGWRDKHELNQTVDSVNVHEHKVEVSSADKFAAVISQYQSTPPHSSVDDGLKEDEDKK